AGGVSSPRRSRVPSGRRQRAPGRRPPPGGRGKECSQHPVPDRTIRGWVRGLNLPRGHLPRPPPRRRPPRGGGILGAMGAATRRRARVVFGTTLICLTVVCTALLGAVVAGAGRPAGAGAGIRPPGRPAPTAAAR